MPIIIPAAQAPLTSLSQQDSATSDSGATITVPGGVQAGDLLVLFDVAFKFSGTPGTVVPADFTAIFNNNDLSDFRSILSYKIADGTEGGTNLTGMDADVEYKLLYVFRGDVKIRAVNVSTPEHETTDGDPASQNVAASGGTAPLLVLACYNSTGGVDPRTFSPAKDGEISAGSGETYLAYKIYNTDPEDVSVDMDDEGDTNVLGSCYLECS